MAIALLPTAPSRNMDPVTFTNTMDAWIAALPGFVNDANTTAGAMSAAAYGGAFALPYVWRNVTTANNTSWGNIISGFTSGGSASANGIDIVTMLIDVDLSGVSIAAMLTEATNSTNPVKGYIKLTKATDPTKWVVYKYTSYTPITSYYSQLAVAVVAYSSTTPFANTDSIMVQFQKTADQGPTGAGGGSMVLLSSVTPGAVAYVDFTSIFSSLYDHYEIDIAGVNSAGSTNIAFNFLTGASTLDTNNAYYWSTGVADNTTLASATSFFMLGTTTSTAIDAADLTVSLRNINSTAKMRGIGVRGHAAKGCVMREGFWSITSPLPTGFRITMASSTFGSGTIKVYGIKNS
jgi:hypothetical protein